MNFLNVRRLSIAIASLLGVLSNTPSLAQPATNNYYYVWDTRPPDDWLSLRTHPSGTVGETIMEMPNGTLLDVLEKRPDGWWFVRVVANGATGWALNRYRDRVWIYCCKPGQNSGVIATAPKEQKKIAVLSASQLRDNGIVVGSLGPFSNKCPTRIFYHDSERQFKFNEITLLSISDEMLNHFRSRGFSLEALCLALHSPIAYDPETGVQLPVAEVSFGNEGKTYRLPLNIPNCFKSGTPILDCKINYLWLDPSADFVKPNVKLHLDLAQRLRHLQPGHWYYSAGEAHGETFPCEFLQVSPNLPRGYGCSLTGWQGEDPGSEKVNLQSAQRKSGIAAPWNQSR